MKREARVDPDPEKIALFLSFGKNEDHKNLLNAGHTVRALLAGIIQVSIGTSSAIFFGKPILDGNHFQKTAVRICRTEKNRAKPYYRKLLKQTRWKKFPAGASIAIESYLILAYNRKIKKIQLGGFKGIACEPQEVKLHFPCMLSMPHHEEPGLQSTEVVREFGWIAWYNDYQRLGYGVAAMQPVSKLMKIAKAIARETRSDKLLAKKGN